MGFTAGKLSGLAGKSSTHGACWFILPFLTTHSLVQRTLVKYPLTHKCPGPGPVTGVSNGMAEGLIWYSKEICPCGRSAETNFPAGIYQGLAAPSPSTPPVFSFEFLVDTNTCGDRNVWSGSWRFTINQYKLLHQKNLVTLRPHPGGMSCTTLNYDPNQSFSFL